MKILLMGEYSNVHATLKMKINIQMEGRNEPYVVEIVSR